MTSIAAAAHEFRRRKGLETAEAGQRVALRLLCGIDLDDVLAGTPQDLTKAVARLKRMIVRERRKGLSGHWSYDLNRHVALKQAFDRLQAAAGP